MVITGQISEKSAVEKKFECSYLNVGEHKKSYASRPGQQTLVIKAGETRKVELMISGLIPFWSKSNKKYYEAPVDGGSSCELLKKRIINAPEFRRPVREARCVIPVDYFIIAENDRAYLFFLTSGRPFALAGIYDVWKENFKTTTNYFGYSILTLPNNYFPEASISKMPLIIPDRKVKQWLKPSSTLSEVTDLMDYIDRNILNGYPIDFDIAKSAINSKSITKPIGDYINKSPESLLNLKSLKQYRFLRKSKDKGERIWRGSV